FQSLLVAAQDQWEDRRLTFQDTKEYFDKAAAECNKHGLPHLASLAEQLKAEMPSMEHDDFNVNKDDLTYKTRLHANDYGRVYNSAFAKALAEDPPQGVKEATFQLGNALANDYLMPKEMNDADKAIFGPFYQQHIEQIQASLIKNQRSWTNQSPLFKAFVEEKDQAKKAEAFEKLLRSPKESGFDCMIIPYIAVTAFTTSPWQLPPWRLAADANYTNAIIPQNQRLDNQSDVVNTMDSHRQTVIQSMMAAGRPAEEIDTVNTKYLSEITAAREMVDTSALRTADAGATLAFQPSVIQDPWMEASSRFTNRYRPDFNHLPEEHDGKSNIVAKDPNLENKLPQAVQQALSHGVPFTGGLSGSTNLLMHFIDDANRRGANINAKDALLSLIMSTGYNGGHVADDCITTAKLLDGDGPGQLNLHLKFGDPSDASTKYVTSLKKLFASTDQSHGVADPVKDASKKAFDKTIEYFREYSHYSNKK
ncbi:MAG: hypothetical protein ACRD5H_08175, partial [Nitrososphaerales archaeon]